MGERTPEGAEGHRDRERRRYHALTPEERAERILKAQRRVEEQRAKEKKRKDAVEARKAAQQARVEAKREAERQKWRKWYETRPQEFYFDLLAEPVKDDVTGRLHKESLGVIHDFMFDFLCLRSPKVKTYSRLHQYLPEWDEKHGYAERWLYFRTLASEPIIQDGPDGPISTMFHGKPWHGLVFRFKGKLTRKCMTVPRGFLKSTIGTRTLIAWKMVNDPSRRYQVISSVNPRAKLFLGAVKSLFEQNGKFRELYGHLKPSTADNEPWQTNVIQLKTKVRRGMDETLKAFGLKSAQVGGHCDGINLDDAVAPENTGGEESMKTEEANAKIGMMVPILDPGAPLLDIGTPWEEGDAHDMFTKPGGRFFPHSSFMVATVMDDDPDGNVPAELGITGRPGNSMWPEKFTPEQIALFRVEMPIDRDWYGQYFCQFTGTTQKLFRSEWISNYESPPLDVAKKRKCDIFMAVDTASGKLVQKGKFDPTGMMVLGKSTITTDAIPEYYVLDGRKEYIAAEDMAKSVVDMAVPWARVAHAMGTTFKLGFEGTAYTTHFEPLIKAELKLRGLEGLFEIVALEHGNRAKEARIRTLAVPYSFGWIHWPKTMFKPLVSKKGAPYDFADELRKEFVGYPMVSHEEALDTNAYCYELAGSPEIDDRDGPKKPAKDPGQYVRPTMIDEEGNIRANPAAEDDQPPEDDFNSGFGSDGDVSDSLGGFDA